MLGLLRAEVGRSTRAMAVPRNSDRTALSSCTLTLPVARVERLLRGCSHKPQHAAETVHMCLL